MNIQEAARVYSEESRMGTIEELQEAAFEAGAIWQEQQGWVGVETPPTVYTTCLIYCNNSVEMAIYLPGGKWEGEDKNEKHNITHWRPLPSPPGSTPVESKEAQEHDKTLNKLYDVQERLARKEDEIGDLVLELQELRARPSKEGKYKELLALAEAELCAMYNRLGFKSSNILNQITDALNS